MKKLLFIYSFFHVFYMQAGQQGKQDCIVDDFKKKIKAYKKNKNSDLKVETAVDLERSTRLVLSNNKASEETKKKCLTMHNDATSLKQ